MHNLQVMRVGVLFIVVALVGGCSHMGRRSRDPNKPATNSSPLTFVDPTEERSEEEESRGDEERRYGQELSEARADAATRAYSLECKVGRDPDRCGLVYDEVSAGKYLKRFVRKVCKLDPSEVEEVTDECSERYARMFFARLVERYDAVPPSKLQLHCDAYPEECEERRALEVWMLKEHNTVVLREWKERVRALRRGHTERVKELDARVEEEREERRERLGQSLMAIAESMTSDLTCKSRKVGDGAKWTSCNMRR